MQIPEENGFQCLGYPWCVHKKWINHFYNKEITHCVQTQGRFQWLALGSRYSLGSGMVQDEVRWGLCISWIFMEVSGPTLDYWYFPHQLELQLQHCTELQAPGQGWLQTRSCMGKLLVVRHPLHLNIFHHLEWDREACTFQTCKCIKLLMFQVDYEFLEEPVWTRSALWGWIGSATCQ